VNSAWGESGVRGDIPTGGTAAHDWSNGDGELVPCMNDPRSIESSIELAGRSGTKRHGRLRDWYTAQGVRVHANEAAIFQAMGGWAEFGPATRSDEVHAGYNATSM
jgi:hypothetical protein